MQAVCLVILRVSDAGESSYLFSWKSVVIDLMLQLRSWRIFEITNVNADIGVSYDLLINGSSGLLFWRLVL